MDIAVEMIGKIDGITNEEHRPLSDFVKFAAKHTNRSKVKQIRQLSADLMMISKFDMDPLFDEYHFHPLELQGTKMKARNYLVML